MLAGFLALFSLVYLRATRSWSTNDVSSTELVEERTRRLGRRRRKAVRDERPAR